MRKKQIAIIFSIGMLAIAGGACTQTAPPQAQTTNSSNTALVQRSGNTPITASNTAGQTTMPPGHPPTGDSSAPKSDAPMMSGQQQAIDTSKFDADISKAEKDHKAKPTDEAAKKALADAYAARGFALTEAAQYRAALGDFRKCLKLDAGNKEAQNMHDQIVSIFRSLNREPPKEGEEPAPLPFKKDA